MPRDGEHSLHQAALATGSAGAAAARGAAARRAKPRLVPLTRALLDQVAALGSDPLAAETAEREEYARYVLARPELAFAALRGGYLLGAGGLVPIWHGRAEAWMQLTVHATRRDLAWATREVAEFFRRRQRDPAFRRIELYVRADQPWRESFARALGMGEAHGPLEAWDVMARDYFLYARVARVAEGDPGPPKARRDSVVAEGGAVQEVAR